MCFPGDGRLAFNPFFFLETRTRVIGKQCKPRSDARSWILNQFKGYKPCISKASLTKLDMHQCVIVKHIYCKFRGIPFSGYLDMARTDGHEKNIISPFLAGDDMIMFLLLMTLSCNLFRK